MLFDTKKTALYLVEAIFKSTDDNRKMMNEIIGSNLQIEWNEALKLLKVASSDQIKEWLSTARKSRESADRICLVEEEFDVFIESYQALLESMDDGFQNHHPENRLKEILDFANGFGIPRVKLRLLLEFTAYADGFDSADIKFLDQALEEIDATIACMSDGAISQNNGSWFYGLGAQEIRDFLGAYWSK